MGEKIEIELPDGYERDPDIKVRIVELEGKEIGARIPIRRKDTRADWQKYVDELISSQPLYNNVSFGYPLAAYGLIRGRLSDDDGNPFDYYKGWSYVPADGKAPRKVDAVPSNESLEAWRTALPLEIDGEPIPVGAIATQDLSGQGEVWMPGSKIEKDNSEWFVGKRGQTGGLALWNSHRWPVKADPWARAYAVLRELTLAKATGTLQWVLETPPNAT